MPNLGFIGLWSGPPLVFLNDYASSFTDLGNAVNSGWSFATDGGLDEIGPLATDRTAAESGVWYRDEPSTGIGSSYDVRCESIVSGDAWTVQAATVGTWVQMSGERFWRLTIIAMASPTSLANTANFQIRANGGSVVLAEGLLSSEVIN